MGGFAHGRRQRLVAVLFAAGAVAVLAVLASALALGAPVPGDSGARISLRAPAKAEGGSRVSLSGTVVGAATGDRVQVQRRVGGGWKPIGRVSIRRGSFVVSVAMPGAEVLQVRANLVAGRRVIATSPIRRIGPAPAKGGSEGSPSPPGGTGPITSGAPAAPTAPTSPTAPPTSEPPVTVPPAEPPPTEPPPTEHPTEPPPSTTNSYWGAWIGSQLTGEEAPWDMNAVTDFEREAGKAPSLIEFASPFSDCTHSPCTFYSFPTTPFEAIRGRGAIPFLSWSSQSLPSSETEPEYQLSDVADGNFDAYIKGFAEAAAAWGHPFFLRFDWEMNGTWFPWAVGANGNTAAEYIAAWRHVHQIFVDAGATNASWVWCPYVNPNSTLTDMATLYPGDEYVDWTCLDGYNWGPSAKPARKWRSFSYLFGPSYRQITESIAPTKPMLIGETASSETGGSKEEWIADAFAALPTAFPRIQGLIWFDKYDDGMDWPIETSSGATAAFKAGIADPRYLANGFGAAGTSPIPAP